MTREQRVIVLSLLTERLAEKRQLLDGTGADLRNKRSALNLAQERSDSLREEILALRGIRRELRSREVI